MRGQGITFAPADAALRRYGDIARSQAPLWDDLAALVRSTGARNVTVEDTPRGQVLKGNDGTIFTFDPVIARGYVLSDWDAINCKATREENP